MNLDEFVDEIREIVRTLHFEDFFAWACYPGQRWCRGLSRLPHEGEPEAEILRWAKAWAMEGEEFLVAYKVDPLHFKAVRRGKGPEESVIVEAPEFIRRPDTEDR